MQVEALPILLNEMKRHDITCMISRHITCMKLALNVTFQRYIFFKIVRHALRPRLVLGWVTTREDRALWIWIRWSVWTWICDRLFLLPLSCWHLGSWNESNQTITDQFVLQVNCLWYAYIRLKIFMQLLEVTGSRPNFGDISEINFSNRYSLQHTWT